jgi:hypothetical protein
VTRPPLPFMLAVAVLGAAIRVGTAGAQQQVDAGLSALLVYDYVDPVPLGGSLGEVRVIHPVAMVHASALGDRLSFTGMGNLEGLTIPDGQLAPGVAGEGYADRRHPHTYLHEAVATYEHEMTVAGRPLTLSAAAGKGFAPYGSDDPMSRPIIRYPVNHHVAQILERLVGIVALRTGPVGLEAALFNGDEPDGPDQWPNAGRFGDSWALRLTLVPLEGVEVQGSLARVASPELRDGGGLDHRQRSVSLRLDRALGGQQVYALAELARSYDDVQPLNSFLGEVALRKRRLQGHYRFERTERPEEQRLADPWRTPRPHHDFSNLGYTRWSVHTLGISLGIEAPWHLTLTPVVEGSLGKVKSLLPGSFNPEAFYGRDTFWMVSAGIRVGWGAPLHRMGRYGAARTPSARDGAGTVHVH